MLTQEVAEKVKKSCEAFLSVEHGTRELIVEAIRPVLKDATTLLTAISLDQGGKKTEKVALEIYKGNRDISSADEGDMKAVLKLTLVEDGRLLVEHLITSTDEETIYLQLVKPITLEDALADPSPIRGKDIVKTIQVFVSEPRNLLPQGNEGLLN